MACRNKNIKRPVKPGCKSSEVKVLGLILFCFGAITLCTFILPLKALIVLLSAILLLCGVFLFIH